MTGVADHYHGSRRRLTCNRAPPETPPRAQCRKESGTFTVWEAVHTNACTAPTRGPASH
jgi:hypothetical protein